MLIIRDTRTNAGVLSVKTDCERKEAFTCSHVRFDAASSIPTLRNMQKLDHCNLQEAVRWMQMEPTLPFRSIDCFWLKLRAVRRGQQRKEGASNLSAMAYVVKDGIRTVICIFQ